MLKKIICLIVISIRVFTLVYAQDSESLRVLVELSSDEVEKNSPFTITVLVDYPEPARVSINTYNAERTFRLIQKSISTVYRTASNTSKDINRWTQAKMVFVPLVEGSVEIPSFGVQIEDLVTWTPGMPLIINPEKKRSAPPVFTWMTPLPKLAVGEWAELLLVTNTKGGLSNLTLNSLKIDVPQEAIIERVIPDEVRFAANVILILKILPLKHGDLKLPVRKTIIYDNSGEEVSVTIPAVNIKIN
jgi:hypothetical protein